MSFFINPYRMVPAIIAYRNSGKYKSYSKARMDSFYVIWGLISLVLVAWLINTVFLAKEGERATLDDLGFYLVLIVSLALIARTDYLFCEVISYYAKVTNHISRLEAKAERMTAKPKTDDQNKGK